MFDSWEGKQVDKNQAFTWVMRHNVLLDEFLADCGNHEVYDAQEVLIWLGY